jgi:hypothetical protein
MTQIMAAQPRALPERSFTLGSGEWAIAAQMGR